MSDPRLDASESIFLTRQLEVIDNKLYSPGYQPLRSRQLLPTINVGDEWANVYTWREATEFGVAKQIADYADDLPRSNIKLEESSTLIKTYGASYGFSLQEIRQAARMGANLEQWKADAARRAVHTAVDSALSVSFLALSGTTAFTPVTKANGGLTWGTAASPNATGREVAADLMGIANKLVETTKEQFQTFKILLPLEQYNYAAVTPIGVDSSLTALKFALETSPYIGSIEPWAALDATDFMWAFPDTNEVVGVVSAMEFKVLSEQASWRNLEYTVPCMMRMGGVISRYPYAIGKSSAI